MATSRAQAGSSMLLALLLAVTLHWASAAYPHSQAIPVSVACMGGKVTVKMCTLDHDTYRQDPSITPMFKDQVKAYCKDSHSMDIADLKQSLDAKGVSKDAPAGFIFHMARCGSTLVANMFGSLQQTLVFSESAPLAQLLLHCPLPKPEIVDHLRTVARAMGQGQQDKKVVFKMQSGTTPEYELIRKAFPYSRFVFLYRNPGEVLVSLLRGTGRPGQGPCLRSQKAPPKELLGITGLTSQQASALPPSNYCAAHLAFLMSVGIRAIEQSPDMGTAVNYNMLPDAVVNVIAPAFGIELGDADKEAMRRTATMYSKGRGSKHQRFEPDTDQKRQELADRKNARLALNSYATPFYNKLQILAGIPPATATPTADASSPDDRVMEATDDGISYPEFFRLGDVLDHWNPDDATVPADADRFDSLARLDYSNEKERELARRLRDAELPFIVYNVPELTDLSKKWTDEYLMSQLPRSNPVAVSDDNHQMYYSTQAMSSKNFKPPTTPARMQYGEWLAKANDPSVTNEDKHYYLRASSGRNGKNKFIADDVTHFNPKNTFFIVDKTKQRGIHCRFGARGIIAEDHYDGGRNFISMIRGTKRYILNPPSQCKHLKMLQYPHPSARHSAVDWSDRWTVSHRYADHLNVADKHFDNAAAIDVVLRAGDTLFVPAFWFHYIVSMDTNIQCNTRSGTPTASGSWIKQCGFEPMSDQVNEVWSDRRAEGFAEFSEINSDPKLVRSVAWSISNPDAPPITPSAQIPVESKLSRGSPGFSFSTGSAAPYRRSKNTGIGAYGWGITGMLGVFVVCGIGLALRARWRQSYMQRGGGV